MNIILMKMEDNENISTFRGKCFLNLSNKDLEKGFVKLVDKSIRKYSKWLGFIYILYSVADLVVQNQYRDTEIVRRSQYFSYYKKIEYFSYSLPGIFTLNIILAFIFENSYLQRLINWVNFLLLGFPLLHLRTILFDLKLIDEEIFSSIRVIEFANRILLIYLLMLNVPESYLMLLGYIVVNIIYMYFIFNSVASSYIISGLLIGFVSYFYTRQVKFNFSIISEINHKNIWYKNFLEYFNSGFISIKNGKIDYINSVGVEIISRIKEISNIFTKTPENNNCGMINTCRLQTGEEMLNVNCDGNNNNNSDKINSFEEKIEVIKNNSIMIMNNILYELFLKNVESVTGNGNNQMTTISGFNENFLDLVKNLASEAGKSKNHPFDNNKFILLGYKEFHVSKEEEERSKNYLEIFYRYNYNCSAKSDEIEIILNDITKIKNIEKSNAYKTQILAKIAHEFKNPIICISELAEQLTETCRKPIESEKSREEDEEEEEEGNGSINIKENKSEIIILKNPSNTSKLLYPHQILQQIKSFSNYLLIQIKNLDYFSHSEVRSFPPLYITSCNLLNIVEFAQQMADILMVKYNKKARLKIVHNLFDERCLIKADEIKLKQILVNLISNAIKLIVSGEIELNIFYDEDKGEATFKVCDTGPGMSIDLIREIYLNRPFDKAMTLENHLGSGLGLSIVLDILRQFNSKLLIESTIDHGSSFSFTLKVEKEQFSASARVDPLNSEKYSIKSSIKNSIRSINSVENSSKARSKRTVQIDNIIFTKPQHFKSLFENLIANENKISEKEKPLCAISHSLKYSDYNRDVTYYIVIDDESIVRNSNIRMLKKAAGNLGKKIRIIEGADGVECIYLVYKYLTRGFKIEAVISDELMTYMNGSRSADILKSLTKLSSDKIPFISITAFSQVDNPNVDFFFSKPLDLQEAEQILKL